MRSSRVRNNPGEVVRTMRGRTLVFALSALLIGPGVVRGQEAPNFGEAGSLRRLHPGVHTLLLRLEQAHGVLLDALAREGAAVRARGEDLPTFGFEFELVDRLTFLVQGEGDASDAEAAAAGYALLGERGEEVVRWGHAFQREVTSILADPEIADPDAALQEAVRTYRSRPGVALPGVPKDMDILYVHPFALGFRTGYADLDGLVWAGYWFRLAVTEPFTDLPAGDARSAGVDTVTARYFAKLSYGEPPSFFPSEIPLAPAIAPGLIWRSPEAAMIWDNLSMLFEVVADVLASPDTPDVESALEATFDFFLDPALAVTDQDEWEIMALRHGIFFQGGYPLAVMTESELNADSHAAHFGGGTTLTIPGMPRR